MGITRRSQFGFPPPAQVPSTYTVREVPLSQGLNLGPWPLIPPGSSTSMSNFLPLSGVLVPRSRLSSLNTLRTIETINGMVERTDAGGLTPEIWVSGGTRHGVIFSTGSISLASFTSAYGLGTVANTTGASWQYAQTFFPNIGSQGNNGLVAAGGGGGGSYDTLLALYRDASAGGAPFYSYLSSAPRSKCVASFDNYIIAWGISGVGVGPFPTRAQWCVRGNPSNWTSEGSGYEDLLEMRGSATAARAFGDSRIVFFSELEIWQAFGATYPAQFQFQSLERRVGCANPLTIAECDLGLLFLGSDNAVRLLPRDGGPSVVLSAAVTEYLRRNGGVSSSWAVFDAFTRLYHLFTLPRGSTLYRGMVLNVDTREWGFADYAAVAGDQPRRGLAVQQAISQSHTGNEGLYFGNSNGTVYSTNSLLSADTWGSAVTARWQSAPIAPDLPGDYKTLTQIDCDYRASSRATVNVKVSQDGGGVFGYTAPQLALSVATVAGRATSQPYVGSAFPAIELTSTSTGIELHRLDVTMNVAGRK